VARKIHYRAARQACQGGTYALDHHASDNRGVIGLLGVAAGSTPAQANCYELIGCTDQNYFKQSDLKKLGCQPLWEVRNWIYKEGLLLQDVESDQGFRQCRLPL
jgi:hypothetical protein